MSYFLAKHPCGKHLPHGPVWMGHVREGEFSRILCTQAVFWAGFGGRICHHHRLQHPGTAQLAPEDLCLQVRLVKVHLWAHLIKAQERFSVDEKIRLEGRHTESQFSGSGHAGLSAHFFVVTAKANLPSVSLGWRPNELLMFFMLNICPHMCWCPTMSSTSAFKGPPVPVASPQVLPLLSGSCDMWQQPKRRVWNSTVFMDAK